MHLAHDPDNFYMIHVDAKSPDDVYEDVSVEVSRINPLDSETGIRIR